MFVVKQKPPIFFGGQEVRNNHTNCAAYSIYSRALLTITVSGVLFIVILKQARTAPYSNYIPTRMKRVSTPHQRQPPPTVSLYENLFLM